MVEPFHEEHGGIEPAHIEATAGFRDATLEAGLSMTPRRTYGNPAWGDFNNDGCLDLLIGRHYTGYSLYRNNCDGTFTLLDVLDFRKRENPDMHGGGWADFNNDGLLDLYVPYGASGGPSLERKSDQLYINTGNEVFVEISASAGTTNSDARARSVCVFDVDNDGYVDIYVPAYQSPDAFFRNNGDETFTDIAPDLRLDDIPTAVNPHGGVLRCAAADYDKDGDMDVLVSGGLDRLLRNDDGVFVDVSHVAGITSSGNSQGIAWGDFDNDGWPDLFLAKNAPTANRLYRNNGDGTFTDVSLAVGLATKRELYRGAAWGDYDNDGHLDLVIVNFGDRDSNGLPTLYRNNGDASFTDVTMAEGLAVLASGRGEGAAWGDYNDDGFLDLVISNGKSIGQIYPAGRDILYKNLGNTNNWIKIIPEGRLSNRAAIGVKVTIVANGGLQFRELNDAGGGQFHTQSHGPLHFGVGEATTIDSLVLEWPSGIRQELVEVGVNQTIRVVEQILPTPGAASARCQPKCQASGRGKLKKPHPLQREERGNVGRSGD